MRIRPPTDAERLPVAAMHVRAWQAGYRGLLPGAYLDALSAHDRARRYTFDSMSIEGPCTLVADEVGVVLGMVTIGRCRDNGLTALGEVWALYVDPDHWRQGVGSELLRSACRTLREAGFDAATLWVMADNRRARHFYEAAGWGADGAVRTDVVAETGISEVRYRRGLG